VAAPKVEKKDVVQKAVARKDCRPRLATVPLATVLG
jgi:hypothetical protein